MSASPQREASGEGAPQRETVGRQLGRVAAFPLLRLIEPRFADVVRRLTDLHRDVKAEGVATRKAIETLEPKIGGYADSAGESLTFVGTQLRDLVDEIRRLGADQIAPDAPGALPAASGVEESFALRALARVTPPARVLDVYGAQRRMGAALATLGFDVTGLDLRPYRHEHPGLDTVPARLEALEPDEPFVAACCLDGLAPDAGGAEDAVQSGRSALSHLRRVLDDSAVAVLALPVALSARDAEGVLDAAGLDRLLEDWRVLERMYVREALPGTWVTVETPDGRSVALVVASPA